MAATIHTIVVASPLDLSARRDWSHLTQACALSWPLRQSASHRRRLSHAVACATAPSRPDGLGHARQAHGPWFGLGQFRAPRSARRESRTHCWAIDSVARRGRMRTVTSSTRQRMLPTALSVCADRRCPLYFGGHSQFLTRRSSRLPWAAPEFQSRRPIFAGAAQSNGLTLR